VLIKEIIMHSRKLFAMVGMIAVTAMLYADVGNASEPQSLDQQFQSFQEQYHKVYASPEIAEYRKKIFAENLAMIRKRNAEHHSYQLGINEYADLTWEEFSATRLLKPGWQLQIANRIGNKKFQAPAGIAIPLDVDWRTKGTVTPVKNQGECGSSWAFATTGLVEGAAQIATGTLHSLSEQEFLDCNTSNAACIGGQLDKALSFAEGGMTSESNYPYTARAGTCRTTIPVVTVSGYSELTPDSEAALITAVNQQPVAVGVKADSAVFQFYHSGILGSRDCGTVLNHALLVVGYTSQYWIVKNSWGTSWGSDGYVFIGRNGGGPGICGITSYAWTANAV
jgi:xylem cysteine proteinase